LIFVKEAGYPLVVKADGLAAGKGAVVCHNRDEACATVEKIMVQKVFGSAGLKLVIEEFLQGEEVTVNGLHRRQKCCADGFIAGS
jgi:phosphoribosylamine-glycine ligase